MPRGPVFRLPLSLSVPTTAALNSGPNACAVSPGLPKRVPGYAATRKGPVHLRPGSGPKRPGDGSSRRRSPRTGAPVGVQPPTCARRKAPYPVFPPGLPALSDVNPWTGVCSDTAMALRRQPPACRPLRTRRQGHCRPAIGTPLVPRSAGERPGLQPPASPSSPVRCRSGVILPGNRCGRVAPLRSPALPPPLPSVACAGPACTVPESRPVPSRLPRPDLVPGPALPHGAHLVRPVVTQLATGR